MHMKLHKFTMVKRVSEDTMAGDSVVEKKLNAYLTKRFISETYIPDDECLSEARHILTFKKKGLRGELHKYLEYQFGVAPSSAIIKDIAEILKERAA